MNKPSLFQNPAPYAARPDEIPPPALMSYPPPPPPALMRSAGASRREALEQVQPIDIHNYDYVIVGCGFVGSVVARKMAEQNKKCLILERRRHIAGNMFDEVDENGILVQRYGVHLFHTGSEDVWDVVKDFGDWRVRDNPSRVDFSSDPLAGVLHHNHPFENSFIEPVVYPFNFSVIDTLYGGGGGAGASGVLYKDKAAELKEILLKEFPGRDRVTISELYASSDKDIIEFADILFELDFRPYTSKQWGVDPEQLDASVINRVPMLLNYGTELVKVKYQRVPKEGFAKVFERMLRHQNIDIALNTDALDHLKIDFDNNAALWDGKPLPQNATILWTGAIDELAGYKLGKLPYRSLAFDWRTEYTESYQPGLCVAYPNAKGYTRIVEYKKLLSQYAPGVTSIAVEYPLQAGKGMEPYYPILTCGNKKLYEKYRLMIDGIPQLALAGRLADYKYYDMDAAIERALEIARQFNKKDAAAV
ncbi:MAG: UDP-galactopyranose mutase [Treponema sp.]|jgi:UDP-galactopyranose mutase|nr:UDP-galactopyranose mutase [Treponema sp.]